jgi:hypothetical protein
MAAFSVVTLAMLPFLGPYPAPAVVAALARPTGTARLGLLLPAIAALFLFQAGNMVVGAYTISLGRSAGLDLSFASGAVGAASWVGLAGAALVALFSTRFGRAVPVTIAFAVTLIATWLFHRSGNASLFVASNFGAAAVWGFVLSYLFDMCGQLDRRGFAAMASRRASIRRDLNYAFCRTLLSFSGPAGLVVSPAAARQSKSRVRRSGHCRARAACWAPIRPQGLSASISPGSAAHRSGLRFRA